MPDEVVELYSSSSEEPQEQEPDAEESKAQDEVAMDDSSYVCSICLDVIAERGSHRPAALRCGHIFGESCIAKWLKQKRTCPHCQKKCRPTELTPLFNLPKVAKVDSISLELEEKLKEADKDKKELQEEIRRLRAELTARELSSRVDEPSGSGRALPYRSASNRVPPGLSSAGGPLYGISHPVAVPMTGRQLSGSFQAGLVPGTWQSPHFRSIADMAAPFFGQLLGGLPAGRPVMLPTLSTPYIPVPPPYLSPPPGVNTQVVTMFNPQQLRRPTDAPTGSPGHPAQPSLLPAAGRDGRRSGPWQRDVGQGVSTDALQPGMSGPGAGEDPSIVHVVDIVGAGSVVESTGSPRLTSSGSPGRERDGVVMQGGEVINNQATRAGVTLSVEGVGNDARLAVLPGQGASTSLQPVEVSHLSSPVVLSGGHHREPAVSAQERISGVKRTRENSGAEAQRASRLPPFSTSPNSLRALQLAAEDSGRFQFLQSYSLWNSRSFSLHVPSALLLVPDADGVAPGSGLHIKKHSIVCPGVPTHIPLPGAAKLVKDISYHSAQKLAAVATTGSGLLLASTSSDNVVAKFNFPKPVWSVSWSSHQQHQLLVGLANGQVGVVDMRHASQPLLVSESPGPPCPQPIHTVIAMDSDSSCQDILAASAAGVYRWNSQLPNSFQLLTCCAPGTTCEAISWHPQASLLAVSHRGAISGVPPARHQIWARTHTTWTPGDQNGTGFQPYLDLKGHTSNLVMTRGTFLTLPRVEAPLFSSADEDTSAPWLWRTDSGHIHRRMTDRWPTAITQISAGTSTSLGGCVLAASCSKMLKLYQWQDC